MEIFAQLAEMPAWVARADWDGLEAEFMKRAETAAGVAEARRVARLDFAAYERKIDLALPRAVAEAVKRKAAALYFEYDLDNDWQSAFFICPAYQPADDEWACEFVQDIKGPDAPAFTALYAENGFADTPRACGLTLALVARTVAAFGRCLRRYPAPGLAVCMGFHDQSPILRVQEAKAVASTPHAPAKRVQMDELAFYLLRNYPRLAGAVKSFDAEAAARLVESHADEVVINRCTKCGVLAKTPKAKQCLACGHDWH